MQLKVLPATVDDVADGLKVMWAGFSQDHLQLAWYAPNREAGLAYSIEKEKELYGFNVAERRMKVVDEDTGMLSFPPRFTLFFCGKSLMVFEINQERLSDIAVGCFRINLRKKRKRGEKRPTSSPQWQIRSYWRISLESYSKEGRRIPTKRKISVSAVSSSHFSYLRFPNCP